MISILFYLYSLKHFHVEHGVASFYADAFHGRVTASGEVFNQYAMTAAHPTLKFGTKLLVCNLRNNRMVIVRVNDRGPYVNGRVLDLSYVAAQKLGYVKRGIAKVKFYRLGIK